MRRAGVRWAIGGEAAIGLAFGAFVVARAVCVPLTYDEAAAYLRYIAPHTLPEFEAGPLAIFNFEVATNHFLSTVLAKLSTLLAGSSELVLRAPALLGYILYVGFSVRLLRRLASSAIAVAGLLLLNLNPYLLDFFSLSRGYGLSIGLMMGALYFLFADRPARALFLASAAVLANFSMLNVYVAIVALVIGGFHRPAVGGKADSTVGIHPRRTLVLLPVVAASFAAFVFSQDPALSPSLYEPVTVRIQGLDSAALHTVKVWRIDLRGRVTPLAQARVPVRALRVEVPAALSDRVARVEVVIGNRVFDNDPHRPGIWLDRDLGDIRQFESGEALSAPRSRTREFRPVINWAGDRKHAIAIARAAAVTLVLLALFAAVLEAAGSVAVRMGVMPAAVWRTIWCSAVWLAAFAGPPLYLLKRDAQLYFGGTRGLVQDTFYSLIESSFYGRTYFANETQIALVALVAVVGAFMVFAVFVRRRAHPRTVSTAAQMLGVLVVASLSLVAQRWLFGNVYLMGRTALLYVPVFLLFLILFSQSLAERGPIGRAAAAALLAAAISLSAYHFARTANLQYAYDWRDDAATRKMMADLERVVAAEGPPGRKAVLGAEWIYAPVAVYYARRHEPVDVDVAVAPFSRTVDFVYVAERHAGAAAHIIGMYPIAGAVLARAK